MSTKEAGGAGIGARLAGVLEGAAGAHREAASAAINGEQLSDAYESVLAVRRTRARKAAGAYYTPPELVERLLDSTLEPVIERAVGGARGEARAGAILSLRVCDPACGGGRFLLGATRRLARAVGAARGAEVSASIVRQVISRCIHGMDVDADAVTVCRAALWLEWALAPGAAEDERTFDAAVVRADSLREGGEYDVVVGNPPWVSFTGRQRVRVGARARQRLVEEFPSVSRWPSLHGAMLVRASELVREEGRIGLVLPLAVAGLESYAGVRAAAGARARLAGPVVDVGERSFGGVVQPAGLFTLAAVRTGEPAAEAWSIESTGRDDGVFDEVRACLERAPCFEKGVFSDPGVHTGNMAARVIADSPPTGPGAPVREGRDIGAFVCAGPRRWVRTAVRRRAGDYCTIRELERYTGVPILVRQTADRPIACCHTERTYFRNSVLACHGVEGIPDGVVAAYLNSALYAWRHRSLALDARQRAFPQVKVRHLHALPALPRPALGRRAAGVTALERIQGLAREAEACAASGGDLREVRVRIERLVVSSFGLSPELAGPLFDAVERGGRGGAS